jgi:predicted TIM-barrel fold metal-dependent hydrolase
MANVSRRQAVIGLLGATLGTSATRFPVIETHVHLFDPERVPYAPNAPYKPPAYTLEDHVKLAQAVGLAHSIIVHPEPYQDDHRYLEYCLEHEPRPGYFKATCLFDPCREDTTHRLRSLVKRWPKRIVAMRIHEMTKTPESAGPIRNRDMNDPRMRACWRTLSDMGLGIQMHFIPAQAPAIRALAADFRETTVILNHMGRPGQGTEAEYQEVLNLAKLPKVILKFSNWAEYKGDLPQLTRRMYEAFGPDRMIWGMVGADEAEYRKQSARFEELLAFAPESARARIRGGNAQRLFYT